MQYEIKQAPFGVVVCHLEKGESMKCQAGAMTWMERGIEMATKTGGLGKMFKKAVTGESLFHNTYTAHTPGEIAFGMHAPGVVLDIDVSETGIVCQKGAFLACEETVEMDIFFRQKISSGLFSGEGFIMQSFHGRGRAFIEIDGGCVEKELGAGEELVIDSGNLAAMSDTCSIRVEMVKGLGNIVAGGEGLFNTVISGPGHVWLQTMPISTLASAVQPFIVQP